MSDDVFTDCPACGREIEFYQTVDQEPKQCPECGTDKDELFEIAIGSQPIEPAPEPQAPELALTDGGRNE